MSDAIEAAADAIVTRLFTEGGGREACRLVLEFDGQSFGNPGWGRRGMKSQVLDALRASLPRAAMRGVETCPRCGSDNRNVARTGKGCAFHSDEYDEWHDATPPRPVTPGEERGVECPRCDGAPFYCTHPAHEDAKGEDGEAIRAQDPMAEYVAASLAWWLDDSDEAGNFDGPTWQRFWNAYYSLPVEVRRGAK